MSKDKVREIKSVVTAESPVSSTPAVPATPPVGPAGPAPVTKMMEEDRMALELAKSRRETALAQAKEALAKNETADISYKYVVLQLYMKYGLTAADAISENGDIVRGGALPSAQAK